MHPLRDQSNLRAAFDVWPESHPVPRDLDAVARGAFDLTVGGILAGRGAAVSLVRYADDGVMLWKLDRLEGMSLDDLVRAVVRAFEPHAYAIAVVQPLRRPGEETVRGVHCRAALGDDLLEIQAGVVGAEGPPEQRSLDGGQVRRGRAHDDRGRWIGVPPTVEIELPMLGAGEA